MLRTTYATMRVRRSPWITLTAILTGVSCGCGAASAGRASPKAHDPVPVEPAQSDFWMP
jgi:hypothetical protein